ncbi:fibrinogen C domain-containing protein 1-like [Biomphalaria glabrata]|uniref:Fibrinogen C domain-containing protein 1-like n=1 Tax=Biomphalaria glabrata TaxID=6526 RepID=A0A9W2YQY5_BIOGL|nr:fibrinogen C domain-containing protein 1-like [Biomphalaria glabrata]
MCDTKTDGGGWIIFQKRINGKVDFYRGWKEYRNGFGDFNIGEFYLGNENTFDRDNDKKSWNCAQHYSGAWWYNNCHPYSLNGKWGSKTLGQGLHWYSLTGPENSVSFSEMKLRERK